MRSPIGPLAVLLLLVPFAAADDKGDADDPSDCSDSVLYHPGATLPPSTGDETTDALIAAWFALVEDTATHLIPEDDPTWYWLGIVEEVLADPASHTPLLWFLFDECICHYDDQLGMFCIYGFV